MPDLNSVDSTKLQSFIDKFTAANAAGNTQAAQEAIREYNLTYANNVAQLYGQNFGPGNPAPIGAATLAQGQATGAVGYIPGVTGYNVGQTAAELSGQAATAQSAAGLTGFYAPSSQSQWTPGSFVRMDPSTYNTQQFGDTQISYVLPSGQLQRVSIPQARAMGWNGDVNSLNTTSMQHMLALEAAPPAQLPQQTLQGLTGYSNLNTAAQNNAISQAEVTGYYQQPQQVYAPGTDLQGSKFSDLPPATQQAYFAREGGDWSAAMNGWVQDSNANIRQWAQANGIAVPGGPTAPTQTMAREQQTYQQQFNLAELAAQQQANPFRQQQVIGQAQRILGGQSAAGFSAPNTVAGVGTQGGNTQGGLGYLQQLVDDIKNPTTNQTTADQFLSQTPTPNKIDSASFLRAAPSTQNIILQSMQEKYGLDPKDSLTQIQNTLPQFQAPSPFGKVTR
jgi:hypothetical protein